MCELVDIEQQVKKVNQTRVVCFRYLSLIQLEKQGGKNCIEEQGRRSPKIWWISNSLNYFCQSDSLHAHTSTTMHYCELIVEDDIHQNIKYQVCSALWCCTISQQPLLTTDWRCGYCLLGCFASFASLFLLPCALFCLWRALVNVSSSLKGGGIGRRTFLSMTPFFQRYCATRALMQYGCSKLHVWCMEMALVYGDVLPLNGNLVAVERWSDPRTRTHCTPLARALLCSYSCLCYDGVRTSLGSLYRARSGVTGCGCGATRDAEWFSCATRILGGVHTLTTIPPPCSLC